MPVGAYYIRSTSAKKYAATRLLVAIFMCCVDGRTRTSPTNPSNGESPGLIRKRNARRWRISQQCRLPHVHSPTMANTFGPIIGLRTRQYRFRCPINHHPPERSPSAAQFPVSQASHEVIIDHADGLHQCVTNRRADKFESASQQVAAHRVRFGCARRHIAHAPPAILDRLAANETPEISVETSEFFLHREERLRVFDGGCDLQPVPHDSLIA